VDHFLLHVFEIFNFLEALLWISIGVGFLVVLWRNGRNADLQLFGLVLFVTFGISDFVEIHTGAWFRPWWLLAWKAADLAGIAALYLLHRRRTHPPNSTCSPPIKP
jgi:hypothetical protein